MDRLTIGQHAERAGVAASAIRFHESRGLLQPVRPAQQARPTRERSRPPLDGRLRRTELLHDRLDDREGCRCLSPRTCTTTDPGDGAPSRGRRAVRLEPGDPA